MSKEICRLEEWHNLFPLGSKIHSNDTLCKDRNLEWTNEPFSILGITFTTELKDMQTLNFEPKLLQIERDIKSWSKRHISPLGKITVIKSLLLPKLTHLFMALPRPSEQSIKKLEKTLFNFIWSNKNDRISRKNMVKTLAEGGCYMAHVNTFIKSLKLTWIRRIINSSCSWTNIFYEISGYKIQSFHHFGADYHQTMAKSTSNPFWKEVLQNFAELFRYLHSNDKESAIHKSTLWYNPKIKIDGRSMCINALYKKGIIYVQDLFSENNQFLSYNEITQRYIIAIPFTTYLGLKKLYIEHLSYSKNGLTSPKNELPLRPSFVEIICKNSNGSKDMYNILISKVTDIETPSTIKKWNTVLQLDNDFDWKKLLKTSIFCTDEIRLRWFNIRILHRIIATNKYLFQCKINNSPLCSLCQNDIETIEHLFFNCDLIKDIWRQVESWIKERVDLEVKFTIKDIILNTYQVNRPEIINRIILLVRDCIYKKSRKAEYISLFDIKNTICRYYKAEFTAYCIKAERQKFERKWGVWQNLFD